MQSRVVGDCGALFRQLRPTLVPSGLCFADRVLMVQQTLGKFQHLASAGPSAWASRTGTALPICCSMDSCEPQNR